MGWLLCNYPMLDGRPPAKRVKPAIVQLQQRLVKHCEERRDGTKSVGEFLGAIGHCIRLQQGFQTHLWVRATLQDITQSVGRIVFRDDKMQ